MIYPDHPEEGVSPAAPGAAPPVGRVAQTCASQQVCEASASQTSQNDASATPDSRLPTPDSPAQSAPRKRRYTVSDKVLAANRANLVKAMAVAKEIRLRETPRRVASRLENIRHAQNRQRDQRRPPAGRYRHGAYSKDLRRTAPLAGEYPDQLDYWQERLRELFPPRTPRERARLEKVGDRLTRVWRVMASWAHRERLMFYWALERAAAEPRGLGIEHLESLAARLKQALDLDNNEWLEWTHRVRTQQRWMLRAMKEWEREIEGEAGKAKPKPEIDLDEVMEDLGLAGASQTSDAGATRPSKKYWATAEEREARQQEAGWLAQLYAEHGWKMPERDDQEHGYQLHAWLVKAAVVGGDHVYDAIAPELEAAIEKLARATWERLTWMSLERGRSERQLERRAAEWEARPKRWRKMEDPFGGRAGVKEEEMRQGIRREQEEMWKVRERLGMWEVMNPAEETRTQSWTLMQVVEESRRVEKAIEEVRAVWEAPAC